MTGKFSLAIHGGAGTLTREMMTGEQEADYHRALAACLRAGMDAFATKPLTLDDLGQAIGPWLPGAGDVEATLDRRAGDLGSVVPVRKIAETKMKDLNANDIEAAMKIIEGSARSMGLKVVD